MGCAGDPCQRQLEADGRHWLSALASTRCCSPRSLLTPSLLLQERPTLANDIPSPSLFIFCTFTLPSLCPVPTRFHSLFSLVYSLLHSCGLARNCLPGTRRAAGATHVELIGPTWMHSLEFTFPCCSAAGPAGTIKEGLALCKHSLATMHSTQWPTNVLTS